MTDKQIIIDGVDVSGCCQYMPRYMEDYDIDALDYCRYHFKPCKDVDVKYCYYKQLKRKEQECEEYKQTLTEIKEMCSEMNCESLMQNSWCGNTDFKMGCCEKVFKRQILQKISESEADNAR